VSSRGFERRLTRGREPLGVARFRAPCVEEISGIA
jgi:hypothetical protein